MNLNISTDSALAVFNASLQLLPLLIPAWRWPFAPRQVTDGRDLLPLLLAPWSSPSHTHPGIILSRLIQASLLVLRIPPDFHLAAYPLWILLALVRTELGFILTRSVGWALPPLFRHWALYEETSGLGATMVMYFYMAGIPEGMRIQDRHFLLLFPLVLGWLENSPWTYGTAIVIGIIISTIFKAAFAENKGLPIPTNSDPPKSDHSSYRIGLLSLILLSIPYALSTATSSYTSPSTNTNPSLSILVLTFPRPGDSDGLLSTTIASYVPHLSNNVTLSVFTHATGFAAFAAAQASFSDVATFHADADSHPVEHWGHYLHLSEALKWVEGEWIMLIEDDFPLCPGRWSAIEQVLDGLQPEQAGFVGTGGSGFIIHRSRLRILADLLKLHAEHPVDWRKPPDVVIQDCLLGVSAVCRGQLDIDGLGRGRGGGDAGGMVITSKLVLDHIGGMASTTPGKKGNTDKWRCGWRNAFHGKRGVEVVVV